MNLIQIQVIGKIGSGKSAIEQEIVDALRKLGLEVKWDTDQEDENDIRKTGLQRLDRLESIAEKTLITVKGIQTKRDINESLNYRVKNYKK